MKKESYTQKELRDMREYYIELGRQQARKEIGIDIARALGLYDIFKTED